MKKRVIALADWYWGGHHANYFVSFALAMAKVGHRVLPLCSDPEDFGRRLAIGLSESGNENLAELIIEPLKLDHPKGSKIRPSRYRGVHKAWNRFGTLGKRLRKWENSEGEKIERVFFAYMYDHDFSCFEKVQKSFRFSWSGLYANSRAFRMPGSPMPNVNVMPCPEKTFSPSLMCGVAVLDEGAVESMHRIVGNKEVVIFPDLTNEQVPAPGEDESGLANKIKSFAQGRPIVCLLGDLRPSKGFEDLTCVAQDASMQEVVFVLGGGLSSDLADGRYKKMKSDWANMENVFTHFCVLSDAQINAVMSIADITYAAYRDFPNSSNMLTKVAALKRPIIVSDGYLMAERTRAYGLGEVVAEGDHDNITRAIARMLAEGYMDKLRSRARWNEYQALHSVARLPECFEKLLGQLDAQGSH